MGRGRQQRRVQGPRREVLGARQARHLTAIPTSVVFDLDGTLLDSDEALVTPFVTLGVPREHVTFGHVLADECARLGISIDRYLDAYDVGVAMPFDGVDDLLRALGERGVRWAVCSNKVRRCGVAELARLGWTPEVSLFAEDFGGPKRLRPVLDALGAAGSAVVFVGDTAHDRECARAVGARFALAGWNARAAAVEGDVVLTSPLELLGLL